VVADDVPVLALRAGDQHRPVVVALLGDAVARARVAGLAGEGELVVGLLFDVGFGGLRLGVGGGGGGGGSGGGGWGC
jgi:hypothetical protein